MVNRVIITQSIMVIILNHMLGLSNLKMAIVWGCISFKMLQMQMVLNSKKLWEDHILQVAILLVHQCILIKQRYRDTMYSPCLFFKLHCTPCPENHYSDGGQALCKTMSKRPI